jgi:hypothetical protein
MNRQLNQEIFKVPRRKRILLLPLAGTALANAASTSLRGRERSSQKNN